MSRKPSFANLRGTSPVSPPTNTRQRGAPQSREGGTDAAQVGGAGESVPKSSRAPSREGRKQIAGFFIPELSLAMHMLALRQNRSLQSLMAEAFNDLLRKHGESPVGE